MIRHMPGGVIQMDTERDVAVWRLSYLHLPVNRWGAFRWWLQGGTFSGMIEMWRVL